GSVRDGLLTPGTRLPAVRQLATDLGVAANTVAKAYRQLEAEGHVETRGRGGTVVLAPPGSGAGAELDAAAGRFVREARGGRPQPRGGRRRAARPVVSRASPTRPWPAPCPS